MSTEEDSSLGSFDGLVAHMRRQDGADIQALTYEWVLAQGGPREQLEGLRQLLDVAEWKTEVIGEIVLEAWTILQTTPIWNAQYASRAEAEAAIDNPLLRDVRLRAGAGRRRKDKAIQTLRIHWADQLQEADISHLGETRLTAMAAVSKKHSYEETRKIVIQILMGRLRKGLAGRGSTRDLITSDWQGLQKMDSRDIQALLDQPEPSEEELYQYNIDIARIGLIPCISDNIPVKGGRRRPRRPIQKRLDYNDDDPEQSGDISSSGEEGATRSSVSQEGAGSDNRHESAFEDDDEDSTLDDQRSGSSAPEDGDGDIVMSDVATKSISKDLQAPKKLRCKCIGYSQAVLDTIARKSSVAARLATEAACIRRIKLLLRDDQGLGNLCSHHVRRLGAHIGLQVKSLKRAECERRLMGYWENRNDIPAFKSSAKTKNWWRLNKRGWTEADDHGVYAQRPTLETLLINISMERKRQIVNEILPGGWEEWQENGTLLIEGYFSWLWDGLTHDGRTIPGIGHLIDQEFEMYLFHQTERNGAPNKGWLRTMFYSLTQQLIRQDTAYWLLYACLRPDGNVRLVSYPYYAKYARGGDATYFRHIDMNVPQYLESGRGKSIIQGSVSLDNESTTGCTELVLGFQHNIAEWWERVVGRGKATDGWVHGLEKLWQDEDIESFGDFVPVPCQRGDVRITMPEIPHGSTKTVSSANNPRRTILPWFVGVREDGKTLDNEESEDWNDLAAAHASQKAPRLTPSGLANKYGPIPYKFPASTQLKLDDPVSQALVCQNTWDDPVVQVQANLLLGPDRQAAWAAIMRQRLNGLKAFHRTFRYMKMAEEAYYGEGGYFKGQGKA